MSKPAQTICYRLKAADATPHLQAVGQLLLQVWAQLEAHEADANLIAIVARVIREQYQVEGENPLNMPDRSTKDMVVWKYEKSGFRRT